MRVWCGEGENGGAEKRGAAELLAPGGGSGGLCETEGPPVKVELGRLDVAHHENGWVSSNSGGQFDGLTLERLATDRGERISGRIAVWSRR